MRRAVVFLAFLSLLVAGPVWAGALTASTPVPVSNEDASPLADCDADEFESQPGTVFLNSEVEPWVDVNPTNSGNLVAAWQQDRWSNGASRGNVVGVSTNGGADWTVVTETNSSICTGGPEEYTRASDPWVTFAPNGDVYLMTLAVGTPEAEFELPDLDAMLVSKSTDGGFTWSDPIELIRDELATVFNDKNTMTADRNDPNFVYAVWDRLVFPNERAAPPAENALAFRGPVLFTRTTNAGALWEDPRVIFDPGQNNQTIGNQIAVLPDNEVFDGELVNIFNLIINFQQGRFFRGEGRFQAAVLLSEDRGDSWSSPVIIDEMRPVDTLEPQEQTEVRDGNIIPDIAVDADTGTLYAVWMDARFSAGSHNDIALAMSTDGGATWTDPVQVNQTPVAQHAFTASVHVASDGTVGVSYYDFRNHDPGTAESETDHFIVHCHEPDSADTADLCADDDPWLETMITEAPFDILQAPFAGGLFLGDYVGLTNTGANFASVFTRSNSEADPATEYFSSIAP